MQIVEQIKTRVEPLAASHRLPIAAIGSRRLFSFAIGNHRLNVFAIGRRWLFFLLLLAPIIFFLYLPLFDSKATNIQNWQPLIGILDGLGIFSGLEKNQ